MDRWGVLFAIKGAVSGSVGGLGQPLRCQVVQWEVVTGGQQVADAIKPLPFCLIAQVESVAIDPQAVIPHYLDLGSVVVLPLQLKGKR